MNDFELEHMEETAEKTHSGTAAQPWQFRLKMKERDAAARSSEKSGPVDHFSIKFWIIESHLYTKYIQTFL